MRSERITVDRMIQDVCWIDVIEGERKRKMKRLDCSLNLSSSFWRARALLNEAFVLRICISRWISLPRPRIPGVHTYKLPDEKERKKTFFFGSSRGRKIPICWLSEKVCWCRHYARMDEGGLPCFTFSRQLIYKLGCVVISPSSSTRWLLYHIERKKAKMRIGAITLRLANVFSLFHRGRPDGRNLSCIQYTISLYSDQHKLSAEIGNCWADEMLNHVETECVDTTRFNEVSFTDTLSLSRSLHYSFEYETGRAVDSITCLYGQPPAELTHCVRLHNSLLQPQSLRSGGCNKPTQTRPPPPDERKRKGVSLIVFSFSHKNH